MAGWFETAQEALTLIAFWSAFPRFADLGAIEDVPAGSITVTPSPMTVAVGTPLNTVVATLGVSGGPGGTYTYTLTSDPLGYFKIVGNQLQVNSSSMVVGTDNILITATGSLGDTIQLPTYVIITPAGYVPTYYLIGF